MSLSGVVQLGTVAVGSGSNEFPEATNEWLIMTGLNNQMFSSRGVCSPYSQITLSSGFHFLFNYNVRFQM